jgi:hypothetical protein
MEQQKGSFKNSENQDRKTVERQAADNTGSLQNRQGIITHSDPKSRDDNRNSKGPGAGRAPEEESI